MLAMIAGIYGNMNYDGEKVDRREMVQSLDDSMEEALAAVYGGGKPREDEFVSVDDENPFFAKIKLPEIEQPEPPKMAGVFEVEVDE